MIYRNNEMENTWTLKENSNTSTTQWIITVASKKHLWGCYTLTLNKNCTFMLLCVKLINNIARR